MKRIALIFTLILIVSCSAGSTSKSKDVEQGKSGSSSVEYKIVMQSEYGGKEKEGFAVIRSANELKEYSASLELKEVPQIDFNNKMAVIIFMGQKSTGGYAIGVDFIAFKGKVMYIKTKKTSPEGMATHVMTAPFCIVEVPLTEEVAVEL